jgi:hypothetical protein
MIVHLRGRPGVRCARRAGASLHGFAVQRAGREDETLILIPDEESELDRRKTLEMFGRPPAGSLQSEPMESELRNMLSTFGKVATWAKFSAAFNDSGV